MFDLSIFDTVSAANKGTVLHLLHPVTGEPVMNGEIPLTMSMYGADGDMSIDALQVQVNRLSNAKKAKGQKAVNIRESIAEASERYARFIFAWTGFEGEKGKALDCTFDNVRDVLLRYKDIRIQVSECHDDKVNFIKG